MIFEAFGEREENSSTELFILAIATSIDAFAVGIVFAAQKTELMLSVSMIGTVTFVISFIGVALGNHLGNKYEKKAEVAGGMILIIMGLKLLLEGLKII